MITFCSESLDGLFAYAVIIHIRAIITFSYWSLKPETLKVFEDSVWIENPNTKHYNCYTEIVGGRSLPGRCGDA